MAVSSDKKRFIWKCSELLKSDSNLITYKRHESLRRMQLSLKWGTVEGFLLC
mgnify:CR=1 FL=1